MIISAFCGTGKTYLCDNNEDIIEFECWKYKQKDFPDNCIQDILDSIDKFKIIFISTNPLVINKLVRLGMDVLMVYPDMTLKEEYIKRFKKRGSTKDFILMLDKWWEKWIAEIEENQMCKYKVKLKSGDYLSDVYNTKKTIKEKQEGE